MMGSVDERGADFAPSLSSGHLSITDDVAFVLSGAADPV